MIAVVKYKIFNFKKILQIPKNIIKGYKTTESGKLKMKFIKTKVS